MSQKDAPWWARISAISAITMIAVGSVYTLRQDVQAALQRVAQTNMDVSRTLDQHVADWSRGQVRQELMWRAICLNAADTWLKMNNCMSPADAVWPNTVGVRPVPIPQRRLPVFPGISVN